MLVEIGGRCWKELATASVNVFGAHGAEAHDVLHPKIRH
jgi:hypothetical protein